MTKTSKQLLFLSLCAILAAGCTVKPVPLTQIEVTTQISTDLNEINKDKQPLKGPLTLDEAIRRTLAQNLEYRLKLMEEALSLKQIETVSYEMLPKLAASAGYTERDKENASTSISLLTGRQSLEPSFSQEKGIYTADLSVTWNILDFGVSYFQAKQQADRSLIMSERRRKVIHNLIQQVRYAYWLALGAQQLQGRFEPVLKDVQKALDDAERIEKERLRAPLEALNYRKTLLETMRQIESFRDELNQAKPRLATLMNLPPGHGFTLAADSSMDLPSLNDPLEMLETLALRMRPELMEARLQDRINIYETKKAIARMLPGVDLTVGKHFDSNSFLANSNWIEGGARASWNLMSLITGPAQYKLAKTQEDVGRISRLALSMAVLTQVHVAYQDFFSKKRQYGLSQEIRDLDAKIYNQTKNAADTGAQNRLNEIRAAVGYLMADYRSYQNFAALQNAYGQMMISIGADPLPGISADLQAPAPAVNKQ